MNEASSPKPATDPRPRLRDSIDNLRKALDERKENFLAILNNYSTDGYALEQRVLTVTGRYLDEREHRAETIRNAAKTIESQINSFSGVRAMLSEHVMMAWLQMNTSIMSLIVGAMGSLNEIESAAVQTQSTDYAAAADALPTMGKIAASEVFALTRALLVGEAVLQVMEQAARLVELWKNTLGDYLDANRLLARKRIFKTTGEEAASEGKNEAIEDLMKAAAAALDLAAEEVVLVYKLLKIANKIRKAFVKDPVVYTPSGDVDTLFVLSDGLAQAKRDTQYFPEFFDEMSEVMTVSINPEK